MSAWLLNKRLNGFTLTEILIVLIIIGILIMLAIPRFQPLINRARSTEARLSLSHLHTLQSTHFMLHAKYSHDLRELGFEQETTVADGGTANYLVTIIHADEKGFVAKAVAVIDFDGDDRYNTWEIDQDKRIKEVIPD